MLNFSPFTKKINMNHGNSKRPLLRYILRFLFISFFTLFCLNGLTGRLAFRNLPVNTKRPITSLNYKVLSTFGLSLANYAKNINKDSIARYIKAELENAQEDTSRECLGLTLTALFCVAEDNSIPTGDALPDFLGDSV